MGINCILFFIIFCICFIIFIYIAKTKHNYEYKEDKFRLIVYCSIFIIYNGIKIYELFYFVSDSGSSEYREIIIIATTEHYNIIYQMFYSTI